MLCRRLAISLCGFARQGSQVIGAAVVAFGPKVNVGIGADELKGHVHLVAGARDRALENAIDVERLRDSR